MSKRLPLGLTLVAALQFIAPLLLPPSVLGRLSPVIWALVLVGFAFLGINLLRRRNWSRLATIFLQGFNIIVRLLVLIGHAVQGGQVGNPLDFWLLGTFLASMIVSGIILYYVDLPDIQVALQ
jgi:hypothetical protein